jgi:hypothetical protein
MYNELILDYIKEKVDPDILKLISNYDRLFELTTVFYLINKISMEDSLRIIFIKKEKLILYSRKNKLKKLIKKISNEI